MAVLVLLHFDFHLLCMLSDHVTIRQQQPQSLNAAWLGLFENLGFSNSFVITKIDYYSPLRFCTSV